MSRLDWSAAFEELREGQGFQTRGRTVTEADVVAFASLTGDFHPQHTDVEWASGSEFGQRIAHGMLVVSYAVGLVPLDPERVLALRRLTDVVFKRPVLLGDTIHVSGQVEGLRRVGEGAGLVACRWSIANQRGELCVRATVELLWRCGAGVGEDALAADGLAADALAADALAADGLAADGLAADALAADGLAADATVATGVVA